MRIKSSESHAISVRRRANLLYFTEADPHLR